MNYIDVVILIFLGLGAFNGFRKGLIISIATLLAFALGIYCALNFSNFASNLLQDNTEMDSKFVPMTAFALTFIAVIISVHLLAKMIERIAKLAALGLVNRIAGLVFGTIKSALIASFILVFFQSFDENYQLIDNKTKSQSILYEPLALFGPSVIPVIKENKWYQDFDIDELLNDLKDNIESPSE